MAVDDFSAFIEGVFAPKEATMSLEVYGAMVHQSAWPDIVSKAKRLIQGGQVTILRNAPHHVMGHVIGDHGEYNTEISRTDPEASIIEQWQCECPWDQFAFQRTRKWKKFEGRVCSHVLATYWKGKSTPLDFQPDTGPKPFQNQGPAINRVPAELPGKETPQTAEEMMDQLQQMREQVKLRQRRNIPYLPEEGQNLQLPGFQPTQRGEKPPATNQELIMGQEPESPFRYPGAPEFQRQELQLFDISAPPWNPTPVPPQLPTSVPQGDPPDPADPISGIGFSSIPFGTKRIFDSWWGKESGSNGPLPEGFYVDHQPGQYDSYLYGRGPAGENYGHMYIQGTNADPAAVGMFVEPDYRRRGISTALWQEAQRLYPNVQPSYAFSDEGAQWARAAIPGVQLERSPQGYWERQAADANDFALWYQNSKREGRATYAQVVRRGVSLEAHGGAIPMPGAQPSGAWPDGTPRYRMMDLGYHPDLDQRVNADYMDEQGRQGAPKQTGIFMEVPVNSRCEVTDIEPLLKWAHIIVPMSQQAGPLEPQTMEGWVHFDDLKELPDANNPFIRRR